MRVVNAIKNFATILPFIVNCKNVEAEIVLAKILRAY